VLSINTCNGPCGTDVAWMTGNVTAQVAGLLRERRRPIVMAEGQLIEKRIWCLSKANGVLAPVNGREWEEDRLVGEGAGFAWPTVALAGIRGALESQN
jgi:hypothetical protein